MPVAGGWSTTGTRRIHPAPSTSGTSPEPIPTTARCSTEDHQTPAGRIGPALDGRRVRTEQPIAGEHDDERGDRPDGVRPPEGAVPPERRSRPCDEAPATACLARRRPRARGSRAAGRARARRTAFARRSRRRAGRRRPGRVARSARRAVRWNARIAHRNAGYAATSLIRKPVSTIHGMTTVSTATPNDQRPSEDLPGEEVGRNDGAHHHERAEDVGGAGRRRETTATRRAVRGAAGTAGSPPVPTRRGATGAVRTSPRPRGRAWRTAARRSSPTSRGSVPRTRAPAAPRRRPRAAPTRSPRRTEPSAGRAPCAA